jgi:hypothetical protein
MPHAKIRAVLWKKQRFVLPSINYRGYGKRHVTRRTDGAQFIHMSRFTVTTRAAALAAACTITAVSAAAPQASAQQGFPIYGPGINLLTNPGHEHPGVYFSGRGEINVTWDWVPYWEESPPGVDPRDQYYRTPEFRPPFARDFPERVRSGGGSDRWFNYFALNKKAGIMQYVAGVPYGAPIRFSSHLQLWSSNDNTAPARSTNDGNLLVRVCIDQNGGPRDMTDPELVCSDWKQPYDKWEQISVDAIAKNNVVNVLIWSTASIPVEHNDIYADESCFEILSAPGGSGVCLGAGYVPTGPGVQKLPPNYVEINSQIGASGATSGKPAARTPALKRVTAPANNKPAAAVNSASRLNVRESASATSKVLTRAPRGAIVEVLGRSSNNQFYQVRYNGVTGWVAARLVIANALAKSAPVVGR